MSREPMGVVIPPNPGDANYVEHPPRAAEQPIHPCRYEPCCGERGPLCRSASPEPQAPSSAPDTPQRGSLDPGGGSEALRAALEPILDTLYANGQPLIDYIWPLIEADRLAYGDRREATGAERALRDAAPALACEDDYARLMARADEIRGRQT